MQNDYSAESVIRLAESLSVGYFMTPRAAEPHAPVTMSLSSS